MSLSTRQNWKDDHFKNIPIFHEYEISNINDYVRFINSIVPKFMEM